MWPWLALSPTLKHCCGTRTPVVVRGRGGPAGRQPDLPAAIPGLQYQNGFRGDAADKVELQLGGAPVDGPARGLRQPGPGARREPLSVQFVPRVYLNAPAAGRSGACASTWCCSFPSSDTDGCDTVSACVSSSRPVGVAA